MSSMQSVAEVVAAEFDKWGVSTVDAAITGRGDPEGIARVLCGFVQEHLDATPVGGLFYRASAGSVVGVRLDTGEDVVVKAYQERWRAPFLRAVQAVQAHAAERGLPCARPRLAPTQLPGRRNLAVVESWWPDPGMRTSRSVRSRGVSAEGLARQIRICRSVPDAVRTALADHPLRADAGRVYPEPHSPLFDFDSTSDGAAWIDDVARQAASLREGDSTPPVVAHTDWSARNIRLGDDGLRAVYDWDSVTLAPEATPVGQAAVTWCVTSEPGGSEFPTSTRSSASSRTTKPRARAGSPPASGGPPEVQRRGCWPTPLDASTRFPPWGRRGLTNTGREIAWPTADATSSSFLGPDRREGKSSLPKKGLDSAIPFQ